MIAGTASTPAWDDGDQGERAERVAANADYERRVEQYWHRARDDRPAAYLRSLCNRTDHGHEHPADDHTSDEIALCDGQPVDYATAFRPPLPPGAETGWPRVPEGKIAPDGGVITAY